MKEEKLKLVTVERLEQFKDLLVDVLNGSSGGNGSGNTP
jgi:hypothetical protein